MALISKISALLVAVTPDDFSHMVPAERRRCSDLLRHVADMAEPRSEARKEGVLSDLKRGFRAE